MVLGPKGQMQFDRLKQREFTVRLGGALAWPFAVRAE
jgi:hypothetical protein